VLEVKGREDRADEEDEEEKDELEDGEDGVFHGWALEMSLARPIAIAAGVSRPGIAQGKLDSNRS
jgi:hypothetical protein